MLKFQQQLRQVVADITAQLECEEEIAIELEHPANPEFGDFACNAALQMFGRLKAEQKQALQLTSPHDLAEYLAAQIKKHIADQNALKNKLAGISVDGPGFINFTLSDTYLKTLPSKILSQPNFGESEWGTNKVWEIEHTSPNPNKAMHLGHLRNNVTGMAVANLWEAIGVEVIRDAVNNNRGIAIAKLMWGYLKYAHQEQKKVTDLDYWFEHQDEWLTPSEKEQRPDRFVDELYTKAAQDFKNNKGVQQQVKQFVLDWEAGLKKVRALWAKVLSYSYEGQHMTLRRLGNQWDIIWHEHEHYQQGKQLVTKGLQQGVFEELPDGAVLSDLEAYDLPNTIVQKADGTSLYITQDLALTKIKKEQLDADKLHWVVGSEQSLALKQMFAICEQLGISQRENLTHISYGYMSIKGEGKMSSRAGNVIYIDDLIDTVQQEVKEIMTAAAAKKEQAAADQEKATQGEITQEESAQKKKTAVKAVKEKIKQMSAQEKNETAEQIALGAIKYSILKVNRMKNTAFDFETALQLNGDSGPYVQYTHTRARSVLSKTEVKPQIKDPQQFSNYKLTAEEKDILRLIYRYPTVVKESALSYEPSLTANFLYQLAQKFNSFYNKNQILVDDQNTAVFRLSLTACSAQVLKHGLELLGIKTPKKM